MSLGNHGDYSVNHHDGKQKLTHVRGAIDLLNVKHKKKVWLGYNKSWIAKCRNHFQWNLEGCYEDLEEILDGDYDRKTPEDILVCPSSLK